MSSFAPGAVLGGRYALERIVEDDGVTQAWTATDQVLARPVMVDLLPTLAEPAAHDAFVAAVAAAGRLSHPGLVATFDSGVFDGCPYVVTERPVGATLADVLERQGPLAPARAIGIGRQLARALEAAHRLSVVHGGISPTTIVIGEDDRARLSGFAASGTRARLRFGGAGSLAGDVHDLARVLADAVGSLPKPLADALAAADPGGTITTAGAFADALDAVPVPSAPGPAPSPAPRRPPPPPDRTPPTGTPRVGAGSRGPLLAGVAVSIVLVVGIGITAFLLASGPGGSHGTGGPTALGGDLTVSAAHSFNPLGQPAGQTENESAVGRVIDGDTSTVWATSEYAGAKFGNLKPGTGVFVVLNGAHTLQQLTVTSPSRQWVFRVYAAPQPAADLAGWGQPVGQPVTVTSDVTQVDLGGVRAGAVLVWITDLGEPLAHPDIGNLPYRVDVAELAIR